MSLTMAKALVARLKDDEAFRKAVRSLDKESAWRLVEQEGYDCSAEEVRETYDNFGCSITGPRSAWREAVGRLCAAPLAYPGPRLSRKP
jgi:predicted ribosomally synthesized peptide with nif11-like leader